MSVQAQKDETNAALVAYVGVVGGLITLILIILTQTGFYIAEDYQFRNKVINAPFEELEALRADQKKGLHEYRWVDPSVKEAVTIPIEQCKRKVLEQYGGL